MKIAISSDNHLDVNRQDPDEIVSLQANYLNKQNVEYYLFAGDMFNDFQWLLCPVCGSKTRDRIKANTEMKNFPLYCPKCKKETIIAAVLCPKR